MDVQAQQTVLRNLAPLLERPRGDDDRPVALMTCGIAGAGKSTLAKFITERMPQFTRMSVDEIVFEKHGLYGVDYLANYELYEEYLDEASTIFEGRAIALLRDGNDIVLDRSFWSMDDRDEWRKIIEEAGARSVLVYLRREKEVLWQRISERSVKERNANSALDISRELFEKYWEGFEQPEGEGELTLSISDENESVLYQSEQLHARTEKAHSTDLQPSASRSSR